MSGADLYPTGDGGGFEDNQLGTQVDFSFLDFNTQTDGAFNDFPEYAIADQVRKDPENSKI